MAKIIEVLGRKSYLFLLNNKRKIKRHLDQIIEGNQMNSYDNIILPITHTNDNYDNDDNR